MSWVTGWLGRTGTGISVVVTPPVTTPTPVVSPLVSTDSEFHDHAAHSINRLCQFAKRKVGS